MREVGVALSCLLLRNEPERKGRTDLYKRQMHTDGRECANVELTFSLRFFEHCRYSGLCFENVRGF